MEICEVLAPLFWLKVGHFLRRPISHPPIGNLEYNRRKSIFPESSLFVEEEKSGLASGFPA